MILSKNKNMKEWLSVFSLSIFLLFMALVLFSKITKEYVNINSIFSTSGKKIIYILESSNTKKRLNEIGVDVENYKNNIQKIKNILAQKGFNTKIIDENNLDSLTKKDILFVIDAISLSKNSQQKIISFVKNGGSLLFNFDSGFIDEKGNITETKMIETITSLKKEGYIKRDKDNTFFLISKQLSPITTPNSKRLDVVLYDKIPIFSGKEPNLEFVNWAITEPIKSGDKFLPNGALWSGTYGKGAWVYFSFPFYALDSTGNDNKNYYKIFNDIIDYLYAEIKAVPYPYIRYDKLVFVSEDTEYKFKSFYQFMHLAKKYDFNVTAFCVGRLAEKNPSLMEEAGKIKVVEIGSHSYSHGALIKESKKQLRIEIELNKKLLEALSHRKVIGFRPPREEIDERMYKMLSKYGYKYVLGKNLGQLNIELHDGLVLIPRLGTDDYSYLIELDWNKKEIVDKIKQEAKFITSLNACYTLSTHTHLMNYKSNITMLKDAFKFFKKENYTLLKGKDVAFLAKQRQNIEVEAVKTPENIILKIKNKNYEDVKDLKIRVYFSKNINITGIVAELSKLQVKLIKYKNKNYVDVEIQKLRKLTDFNIFIGYTQ